MGWVVRFSNCENEGDAELVTSTLWDLGTTGLFESASGEVVAGFSTELEARSASAELSQLSILTGRRIVVERAASEADWVGDDPPQAVPVGAAGNEQLVVTIRAGATFGHGGHPTTRLALDLLAPMSRAGVAVLDVGTGSGVLAIAAARLGAAPVVGIDIDEAAIPVANDNAVANGVDVRFAVCTVGEAVASIDRSFDVVVANVLLPVHRELCGQILDGLTPGGQLITSGYLRDQADDVFGLYHPDLEVAAAATATATTTATPTATSGQWSAHRFVGR